ncbi:MAG: lysylphosphatidylglycerol synthase transmembrane domain-containing protein [Candidatus Bathyarchaeia archaeon]
MQPPKIKFTYKTVLLPLLGLAGFFLYIYLFKVDIIGIINTAKTANPLIYSVAILFGFVEIFFFTLSWHALTSHINIKLSIQRAFLYVWYGIYVDTIIPAESISGEVTKAYLVARDKCSSFGQAMASLFMHRLLGMAINVVILVAGIALLTVDGEVNPLIFNTIIFVTTGITAVTIALTVLAFRKSWMLKVIDWCTKIITKITRGKWCLDKFRDSAIDVTGHFHDSMTEYRHNLKPVIESFLFLAVTWFFSLAIPYLVFESLGRTVPWGVILITAAIVLAVKAIPAGIPFEVGIPEATMTTLYIAMGVNGALAATATILTRIITLWFRFFAGFVAQQYLELKPAIVSIENRKN